MGEPSEVKEEPRRRTYKTFLYPPLLWLASAAILVFWGFLVTLVFAPTVCPTGLSNYASQRMDQPGAPSYCLVTRDTHRSHVVINTVEPRICAPTSSEVEETAQKLRTTVADGAAECRKNIVLIVPTAIKRMALGVIHLF